MKNLPIIDLQAEEKKELLKRIKLTNRPHLKTNRKALDAVAARLASNSFDRERFIEDPRSYLREQAVPLTSCNLVQAGPAATTEACTALAVCTLALWLAVVAANLAAAANYTYYLQHVYTTTTSYTRTSGPYVKNNEPSFQNFGYVNVI